MSKVIPQSKVTSMVTPAKNEASTVSVMASYEEAAAVCQAKVAQIVKECRAVNMKYRDIHFDVEEDLKLCIRDCLESLANSRDTDGRVRDPAGREMQPQNVKRVGEIFEQPRFYIDDVTSNDVRQGRNGDCWFLAALCTLSVKPGLVEKLCVARDEAVGVYGFVFFRDGQWTSVIVDDFVSSSSVKNLTSSANR